MAQTKQLTTRLTPRTEIGAAVLASYPQMAEGLLAVFDQLLRIDRGVEVELEHRVFAGSDAAASTLLTELVERFGRTIG